MNVLALGHWMVATLDRFMPQILAVGLAMAVALTRALLTGSSPGHVTQDVLLCGFMTIALFPLLNFLGLNEQLAVTLGAVMAFLGLDWTRETLKSLVAELLQRKSQK